MTSCRRASVARCSVIRLAGRPMNVMLNRLDPNVPDPVESRRRAAGRLVRVAYATVVFGMLAFFVVYFGRPLVYLGGPGIVSSPRYVVSLPYTVQVSHMNVAPGAAVQAGEEIGRGALAGAGQHRRQLHARTGGRRRPQGGAADQGAGGAGIARSGALVSAADRGGGGRRRGVVRLPA